MTSVAAEPSAPAPEEERRQLTALESVAALSLDALSSMAICRLRFQFANWASPFPFSCLDDRDELLTAAEESLDLLAHLAASLLDVSQLRAGTLAVFPQPADLGEIVAGSLDGLGPQARAVLSDIPSGPPRSVAPAGCAPRNDAKLLMGFLPHRT